MKHRGDEIGHGSFGGYSSSKRNIHRLCTMNLIHNLYYGRTWMLRKCLFFLVAIKTHYIGPYTTIWYSNK